jgi:uracil-DNA glycosylase
MERDGIKYMITIHPAAAVRIKKKLPIIEADFEKLGKLLETD